MRNHHTPIKPDNTVLDYIREYFEYDPATGFMYKCGESRRRGIFKNQISSFDGIYYKVYVLGKYYKLHHVAWFLYYSEWPITLIDHRDQDPLNNKINNLRSSTSIKNAANRYKLSKLPTGIYKARNRFEAKMKYKRIYYHFGYFYSVEEAFEVYKKRYKEITGQDFNAE